MFPADYKEASENWQYRVRLTRTAVPEPHTKNSETEKSKTRV